MNQQPSIGNSGIRLPTSLRFLRCSHGNKMLLTAFVVLLFACCTSPPVVSTGASSFPACGSFPNCVNSEAETGSQAIEPIVASEKQWQLLTQWISEQEDWEVVAKDSNFIQAVVKTPLLGFKDDVLLRFESANQVIHVRSSSRLGYSDLGVNRQRVESIRVLLTRDTRESP